MKYLILPLALIGSATAAQTLSLETAPAQQTFEKNCQMLSECYDTDGCADTTYSMKLEGRAGGLTADDMVLAATLTDDSETIEMLGTLTSSATLLSDVGTNARRILTISPDGQARFTVHFIDGPVSITYAGICE